MITRPYCQKGYEMEYKNGVFWCPDCEETKEHHPYNLRKGWYFSAITTSIVSVSRCLIKHDTWYVEYFGASGPVQVKAADFNRAYRRKKEQPATRCYGITSGNYQPKDHADVDWVYVSGVEKVARRWVVFYITNGGHGNKASMPAQEFRRKYYRSNK